MKSTWDKNQCIVDKVNVLWQDAQKLWALLEAKRNEAATVVSELITLMEEAAKRSYDTVNIRAVPIVDQGIMTGVQVWIDNVCHPFNIKEEVHGKETTTPSPEVETHRNAEVQLDGGQEGKHVRNRRTRNIRETKAAS